MISSGFTWVPIGGLGESNITLRGLFHKIGLAGEDS